MEFNLKIPTKLYADEQYTDVLIYYALIQPYILIAPFDKIYISAAGVLGAIGVTEKRDRLSFNKAIEMLVEMNIVSATKDGGGFWITRDSYYLDTSNYYAQVYYSDVITLLSSNVTKKGELFRYLCCVMGRRISGTKVCQLPIRWFASYMKCSSRTIIRNNEKLEQLKILYIKRSDVRQNDGGTYYHDINAIGSYKDKELIGNLDKFDAKWQRKVSAKYNYFVEHRAECSVDYQIELYQMCLQYNNYMDYMTNKYGGDEYAGRKKDMAVFDADIDLF